jgi:tight adherence protein B
VIPAATLDRLGLSLLAFAAVVVACLAFREAISAWATRRRERAERIQEDLHLPRPPVLASLAGPALLVILSALGWAAGAPILGILVGVLQWRFLEVWPEVLRARRMARFDQQLPDAMTALANGLRAGLTLPSAVEQVVRDLPAPVSEEFERVLGEHRLGTPIEQAFDAARRRLKRREFDLCVAAFRIGKAQGGDAAQVFDQIAAAVREIRRLEEHIRTVSTQGRSSARFMTFMPAVFLVLLYFMDAESTSLLFTDVVGMVILSVVVIFNLLGHLWIKRLLAVDI